MKDFEVKKIEEKKPAPFHFKTSQTYTLQGSGPASMIPWT